MQILTVVSIFDTASQTFSIPECVKSVQSGVRGFTDAMSGEGPMGKHPEDFELYEVGTWEDCACKYTLLAEPRLVVRGKDIAKGKGG